MWFYRRLGFTCTKNKFSAHILSQQWSCASVVPIGSWDVSNPSFFLSLWFALSEQPDKDYEKFSFLYFSSFHQHCDQGPTGRGLSILGRFFYYHLLLGMSGRFAYSGYTRCWGLPEIAGISEILGCIRYFGLPDTWTGSGIRKMPGIGYPLGPDCDLKDGVRPITGWAAQDEEWTRQGGRDHTSRGQNL